MVLAVVVAAGFAAPNPANPVSFGCVPVAGAAAAVLVLPAEPKREDVDAA